MKKFMNDILHEYDFIVNARKAVKTGQDLPEISKEELDFITSDAAETELLYRASLPETVLKNYYCYSDEAIAILKNYTGEQLEDNPALADALAHATINGFRFNTYSSTAVCVILEWSWDVLPLNILTDIIAVTWDGTYKNGGSNDMKLDISNSYATINYWSGGLSTEYNTHYTDNISLTDRNSELLTHNAFIKFPMKIIHSDGLPYWAKSGKLYIYTKLANMNGPVLAYITFNGEYAHYTKIVNPSVSFPAGISISFSGGTYNIEDKVNIEKTIG